MIYIERTIEIKKNIAKIEEPIILYKGDKNIELQFMIENNPFKYKSGVELTYGQLVVKRPSADPIFSEVAKLSNNKVLFVVTGDMIDELAELGEYDFQIRLINADKTSRGTIPPVTAGIIIKAPLCEEPDNIATINEAIVNDSIVPASNETLNVFDNNGDYIKTTWKDGDLITDSKLNKIEDALYEINGKEVHVEVDLSGLATEDYVNDAIAEAHANADFDLSGYVTNEALAEILRTKADYTHYHDNDYYRKWQIDGKLYTLKDHNHDEQYVTNESFDRAIGDINTILDSINGEEI